MSEQSIVTLLSDFGLQDGYVGVIKGVIAQINPSLKTIDITHQIPPQDLVAARFCLMNAYAYFPRGTVHVAVVDPGVGSERRGVAIQFSGGYLVGPDNGLFSGVLSLSPAVAAVELTHSEYWRTVQASTTFHGRDIFAPVGAYLASGIALQMLGTVIDIESLVPLPLVDLEFSDLGLRGCIQYIDIFGNLITNIPASAVEGKNWSVRVKQRVISRGKTYSDVDLGQLVSLIGSHNWVEIALNGGNAQTELALKVGEPIEILS
ncbi:SAM hydrolase/SAM-dependent halogenase family protein [Gloeothece verrucosa]|uniref:SAM-dependent chlorinase/fluorinase n=1 Tax=Gloeothece verrucosa (strain PCC 7822) TaxID=497965 RepID=E0UAC0_GLOV7|nr:SAM-dependent chlorinase/fluorinase [Gloeothece verrucosa]ADN17425.1 protein of unknown function DUF62 [Gloeothece verrucosa PCC 7822]